MIRHETENITRVSKTPKKQAINDKNFISPPPIGIIKNIRKSDDESENISSY